MTTFERIFSVPNAFEVERNFGKLIIECDRVNARALAAGIRPAPLAAKRLAIASVAKQHRIALNALAAHTAHDADARIRARLKATAVRTPTGVSPHLARMIASRPIVPNSGSVGVARTSTLNRAINPNTPGYGPYWRAQEYGTGTKEVVSQRGRTIVGFFYAAGGSGAGSRPSAEFRGGGGPHPVFIPGSQQRGARGGAGGKGTIRKEIEGRHFIRDGANEAAAEWQRGMRRVEHASFVALNATRTGPTAASRLLRVRR